MHHPRMTDALPTECEGPRHPEEQALGATTRYQDLPFLFYFSYYGQSPSRPIPTQQNHIEVLLLGLVTFCLYSVYFHFV